jgi:hypothetical protein
MKVAARHSPPSGRPSSLWWSLPRRHRRRRRRYDMPGNSGRSLHPISHTHACTHEPRWGPGPAPPAPLSSSSLRLYSEPVTWKQAAGPERGSTRPELLTRPLGRSTEWAQGTATLPALAGAARPTQAAVASPLEWAPSCKGSDCRPNGPSAPQT